VRGHTDSMEFQRKAQCKGWPSNVRDSYIMKTG